MTDGCFFLKSVPPKGVFPEGVKLVALDPVAMGFGCGGPDAYCSTAYAEMWGALGGKAGVVPTLRKKYGVDGRVAFVSFSAGHGFLNPLLETESDHMQVGAVLLLDSTFGGGKAGYVTAAKHAASGGMLLAAATSDKGTKDPLTNGDYAWRKFVLEPAGLSPPAISNIPPMPAPDLGVFRQGGLIWFRYSHAELPHTSMHKVLTPLIKATLLPYWAGSLSTGKGAPGWLKTLVTVAVLGLGGWATWRVLSRRGVAA